MYLSYIDMSVLAKNIYLLDSLYFPYETTCGISLTIENK